MAPTGDIIAYMGEMLNTRIALTVEPTNNPIHADKFNNNVVKCIWYISLAWSLIEFVL